MALVEVLDIDTSSGLEEPSGLALDPTTGHLLTVGDTRDGIYQLGNDGAPAVRLMEGQLTKGLEGIAVDDQSVWVVNEDTNRVTRLDRSTGDVIAARAMAELSGYDSIAALISSGGNNKGLEGIAIDQAANRTFLLKEGRPGVLVEAAIDLRSITRHWVLDRSRGFVDPDTDDDDLDFSGLSYDPARELMWIVSDQGQRVFVFDLATGRVAADFAVDEVNKAEGIALDRDNALVYIMSETDARVYIYSVTATDPFTLRD